MFTNWILPLTRDVNGFRRLFPLAQLQNTLDACLSRHFRLSMPAPSHGYLLGPHQEYTRVAARDGNGFVSNHLHDPGFGRGCLRTPDHQAQPASRAHQLCCNRKRSREHLHRSHCHQLTRTRIRFSTLPNHGDVPELQSGDYLVQESSLLGIGFDQRDPGLRRTDG